MRVQLGKLTIIFLLGTIAPHLQAQVGSVPNEEDVATCAAGLEVTYGEVQTLFAYLRKVNAWLDPQLKLHPKLQEELRSTEQSLIAIIESPLPLETSQILNYNFVARGSLTQKYEVPAERQRLPSRKEPAALAAFLCSTGRAVVQARDPYQKRAPVVLRMVTFKVSPELRYLQNTMYQLYQIYMLRLGNIGPLASKLRIDVAKEISRVSKGIQNVRQSEFLLPVVRYQNYSTVGY